MNNTASNTPIKILVVDDNLLNRKLACAILKGCNIDHEVAQNGKEAFEQYLTGDYNLILMDIQMPIMNGLESTRAIRAHELKSGNLGNIPIIAVTTFTMSSDKKNCFDAGMNEVLGKPYKTQELTEMMSRFLDVDIKLQR